MGKMEKQPRINRRKLVICIVKTIIISAIAILFVMPLIWMGLSALKTTNEVFAHPFKWLPAKPMWSNFKQVWCVENVNMMKSYGNSIIIVFFSTVGQIAIASLAAYAFAKIQFKGKNFVFMMFLASMMIPGQVTIIPRFMLFKSMGLYNTLWSCILPFWFSTTAIFMLRQFYIGLPNDLMEAAKIDGAGHFRIFLQVLMPLTKPAMITLVILAFIGSWNEYLSPLIFITKQEKYTVFINDILTTSIDYMIGLKSVLPDAKIINFEDDGEGILKADLVFNALYHENDLPQVKAGEKYYISGKTFMFYEPIKVKEHVKKVFISFGGADPQNYSDRLLRMITNEDYKKIKFVVVLGRAKYNVETLMDYNKWDNIEVLYDVSNMPELMSSCDIGVTSRGRTGYELAMLGIPSISMAQNQREEKHGFVCNENGFTYIGLNPADEIIESNLRMYINLSKESREQFQNKLLSHDLRGGRKRVMSLINGL